MSYVAIIDIKTHEIIEMVKKSESLSIMQHYIFNGRKVHRKVTDKKTHNQFLLNGAYPTYAKPIRGYGNDIAGWIL